MKKKTKWKITDILRALIKEAKGRDRQNLSDALRMTSWRDFASDPATWLRQRDISIAEPFGYTTGQWGAMTDDQRAHQLVKAAERLNVPKRAQARLRARRAKRTDHEEENMREKITRKQAERMKMPMPPSIRGVAAFQPESVSSTSGRFYPPSYTASLLREFLLKAYERGLKQYDIGVRLGEIPQKAQAAVSAWSTGPSLISLNALEKINEMQRSWGLPGWTDELLLECHAADARMREAWQRDGRSLGARNSAAARRKRREEEKAAAPSPVVEPAAPPPPQPPPKQPDLPHTQPRPQPTLAEKIAAVKAAHDATARPVPAPDRAIVAIDPAPRAVGFVLPPKKKRDPSEVRVEVVDWVRKTFNMKPTDQLDVQVVVALDPLVAALTKFVVAQSEG